MCGFFLLVPMGEGAHGETRDMRVFRDTAGTDGEYEKQESEE